MPEGMFNLRTRQTFQVQNTIPFVDSSPQSIILPQVGLLGKIRILVSGTTTTAAASSATRKTFIPAPLGIVRRVILRSNEGADIYNTSAWGNYLLNKTLRTSFDPIANDAGSFVGGFTDPFTRYFSDGGDLGASASANWRFMLSLPISLGEQNLTGLLMLQNPGVQFTLEIQWGTTSDIYTTVGTVTLSNVVARPELELYHLPADFKDDPDLGFARNIIESIQPITSTGDVEFVPPLGNMYMKLIHAVENNSAPVDITKVNSLKVQYAQSQVAYNQNPDIHLWRQRMRYGNDIVAGVYVHDWGIANNLPEEPTSRDIFDTGMITDMKSIVNLDSSLVLTNAQLRTIRDQLVPTV